MRKEDSTVCRRSAAFEFVLRSAAKRQWARAAAPLLKGLRRRADLRDDVCQVATLLLVKWLAADSLRYEDRGADRFAGWYWSLCRNACRSALRTCDGQRAFRSVESLTEFEQPAAPPPSEADLSWDDLLAAIADIEDSRLQAVMIDMAAGRKGRQTAQNCHISPAMVSKLRQKGLAQLRRRFEAETRHCR
jgi:DNA-directed RNA polymerase specialized sigma24 family protein